MDEKVIETLTIIASWKLPETGRFWDRECTKPISFEAACGEYGARDYMRELAQETLNYLKQKQQDTNERPDKTN